MDDLRRVLDLTVDLVALVERLEPDPGPDPGTTEHSDSELDAWAETLVAACPVDTLHVFAYGSLIWNPEFTTVSTAPAVAHGWRRSFCLRLTRWRGTRERPALMLALDRGGSCRGVLHELPAADRQSQIKRLLVREIDAKPATNVPRWIKVSTQGGPVWALAFVADRGGPAYMGGLTLNQVAIATATAAGHWGSAASYLRNTVEKLEAHGIHDRALWRLQSLVADQIAGGVRSSVT